MRHTSKIIAILVMFFSLNVFAQSEVHQVGIGDKLQLPELTDQFDNKQSLKPETQWVVFSHDMASGDVVELAFEKLNDEKLSASGIQYYADISGMPGLISRFIAIPKLKKLPYIILLGREESDLEHLPREEGKAMIIKLADGKLVAFESTDDPKALQQKVLLLED